MLWLSFNVFGEGKSVTKWEESERANERTNKNKIDERGCKLRDNLNDTKRSQEYILGQTGTGFFIIVSKEVYGKICFLIEFRKKKSKSLNLWTYHTPKKNIIRKMR